MRNIKSIVNVHNKSVTKEETREISRTCSCPRNANCPLNGECLSTNTLYAGTITSDLPNYGEKEYAGLSAPPWKKRLGNHILSFNNRQYAKCEIAKEVWRIKDEGGVFNIVWRIIGHAPAYNPTSKRCSLCLSEKLYIAENINGNLINHRDELISKCRHRNKYALAQLTSHN